MKEAEREERDAKAQRRVRKSFTDEQVATYETWQREQAERERGSAEVVRELKAEQKSQKAARASKKAAKAE